MVSSVQGKTLPFHTWKTDKGEVQVINKEFFLVEEREGLKPKRHKITFVVADIYPSPFFTKAQLNELMARITKQGPGYNLHLIKSGSARSRTDIAFQQLLRYGEPEKRLVNFFLDNVSNVYLDVTVRSLDYQFEGSDVKKLTRQITVQLGLLVKKVEFFAALREFIEQSEAYKASSQKKIVDTLDAVVKSKQESEVKIAEEETEILHLYYAVDDEDKSDICLNIEKEKPFTIIMQLFNLFSRFI